MDDRQLAELAAKVVDHLAELVVVLDQAGTIRYANRRAEQLLGWTREDWIGRPAVDIVHPDDLSLASELLVSSKARGPGVKEPVIFRLRTLGVDWLAVEVIASNIIIEDDELALVLSGRELADRRLNADIVDEAGQRLGRMFDDAAIGMTQSALDGRLLRVNPCFAAMLGYEVAHIVGRHFREFTHPDDIDNDVERFSNLVAGHTTTYRGSKRYVAADGSTVHVEITASLIRDHSGAPLYCAMQTIDVSELRRAQAELLHSSTHDSLTGLANRSLLRSLLDQALSRAARLEQSVGVLFLDLDGFKSVNDTYGHAVGDALLAQVAERLRLFARNGDVVSRLGGDEFVVMCEHADTASLRALAERLVTALSVAYDVQTGVTVLIGASVGVAVEPALHISADGLMQHADAALYEAKRRGRGRVVTHDEAQAVERL